jgi:ADP-ribose pyrophosphatase YjhB (NUDIX family)
MPISKFREITCPRCQEKIRIHANPVPTVDIIIETGCGIVLIERRNPPFGWAIPGGFVDYGECAEDAAIREAKEETGLDIKLTGLLGVYSDPGRDPRMHTISTVFIAKADGGPTAGDDAKSAMIFGLDRLPGSLAFDHKKILKDYLKAK